MAIEIVRADITTLDVDVIVNAANPSLGGGGGVDGAIHRAAGPELAAAATRLAPCPPGGAVITPGFDLRASFVIHAVGPIWHGGDRDEPDILRRTYERIFGIAESQKGISSIAIPAISTGVYGFPKRLAAEIAIAVMRDHEPHFERVVACVFDSENERHYSECLRSSHAS
jgi:O-acetyl-ADP-ribose deacetylase (regulator of RNase III)